MPLDLNKPAAILEFFNTAAAKAPTVEDVKRQFKLADNEIHDGFGVKAAGDHFLAVVSEEAGKRIAKERAPGFIALGVKGCDGFSPN